MSNSTLKAIFCAFAITAIMIGLWFNTEPYACPIPNALLASSQAPQPSCFEFWLNRYQTLIGAAAALFAGILAWRGAMRQVAKADDQVKLLSKQIAVDKLQAIYEKIARIDNVGIILKQFQEFSDRSIVIMEKMTTEARVVKNLIIADKKPGEVISNVLEPLGQELIEKANALAAIAQQIDGYAVDPYLPDHIKTSLSEFVPDARQRADHIAEFVQKLRSGNQHNPYKEAMIVEYGRISDLASEVPLKINFNECAAYISTMKEKTRLRLLRDNAEAAAEL